jgi:SAM-dependent methyltransferase
MEGMRGEEWTADEEKVRRYLGRADEFPHRAEGESVLLEHVPRDARRTLDLGTGDGRLLALLQVDRQEMLGVGLDFSELMLEAARKRFAEDERVLGLSTQNPGRPEYATPAPGLPTALRNAVVHTGRPAQRDSLSAEDGAILETLRDRARYSDLSPQQTVRRLLRLLADERRFVALAGVAMTEPPRVRAMLGAIGQELNMPALVLDRLRGSLNPLSRFDFGRLRSLRHAREWQAK